MYGELLTTQDLIVIVLGIVAALGLSTLALLGKRIGDLAESLLVIAGPGLVGLRSNAESTLAQYGAQLAPVHDVLMTFKPYVDSPDDQLYKQVARIAGWPVEDVAAVGMRIWAEAEDMTDGDASDDDPDYSKPISMIPDREHIAADQPHEAVK